MITIKLILYIYILSSTVIILLSKVYQDNFNVYYMCYVLCELFYAHTYTRIFETVSSMVKFVRVSVFNHFS